MNLKLNLHKIISRGRKNCKTQAVNFAKSLLRLVVVLFALIAALPTASYASSPFVSAYDAVDAHGERLYNKVTCVQENDSAKLIQAISNPILPFYMQGFKMLPNLHDDPQKCKEKLPYDGKIEFCYNDAMTAIGQGIGNLFSGTIDFSFKECDGKKYSLKPGERTGTEWSAHPAFQVVGIGDKICVQVIMLGAGVTIGCQYREAPSIIEFEDYNPDALCSLADSCVYASARHSKNLFPITSVAIQCVKQTLSTIFTSGSCNTENSFLAKVQNNVRQAVISIIVIYFIVIGIKQTLAGDAPSRAEVMMYLAKAILVIYFSVGFSTGTTVNGYPVYSHGVSDLYNFFINAANDFAYMIFSATMQGTYDVGSDSTVYSGMCAFHPSEYPEGYGFLSLWDAIDCRLMFYLGAYVESYITSVAPLYNPIAIFVLIGPALLTGEFFFGLMIIVIAVMVISVILFIANIFLVSLFVIALTVLLAPIFVPMMLFEATKNYFNGWRNVVIGYTIQPMILVAFISMMLVTLDELIYPDCEFDSYELGSIKLFRLKGVSTLSTDFFGTGGWENIQWNPETGTWTGLDGVTVSPPDASWNENNAQSSTCKNSLGYKFIQISSGAQDGWYSAAFLFFNLPQLSNPKSWGKNYHDMLKIIVFLILFYHFAGMIDGLAADLAGSPPLTGMLNRTTSSPFAASDRVAYAKFKGANQAYAKRKKS